MDRIAAAALCFVLGANGLAMLAAPGWWYAAVPGVIATGPFNAHFIRDIGASYLVVMLGLGWFAAQPDSGWSALVCAAVFLCLHAAVHVHDALLSPSCGQDLLRDLPGVFAPAVIASALALIHKLRNRV